MGPVRALLVLACVAILLVMGLPAQTAHAYSADGTVTYVADGDTFDVDVPGDGQGEYRVRFIGIQAPEIGECGADEATNRLETLIDGEDVTLLADDYSSTGLNNRKLRFVEIGGVDVGLTLLQEGLVFAFPNDKEPSRNDQYLAAAAEAAGQGIGLWDSTRCGSGPKQNVDLDLTVQWDADGNDGQNVNGEWIRISNDSSFSVSMDGWTLRDSALNILDIPSSVSIPALGYVTVYVGSGSNTSTKVYWGLSEPILDNVVGDTVVLVDPDGDYRSYFQYPCVTDCNSPLAGKLAISANFDAEGSDGSNPNGEWINVTNISESSLSLEGYLLESWPYSYEFPEGTTLQSGKRIRVKIGSGTDTSSTLYWGFGSGILDNTGDEARIRSFDGVVAATESWPCSPCAEVPDVIIKEVQFDAPGDDLINPNGEWVKIKNRGDGVVDLRNWKLVSAPYHYDFKKHTYLGPGDTLKVFIGSGSDTSSKKYWGKSAGILGNAGDQVELLSPARDLIDCEYWGSYSCSSTAGGSPYPGLEMYVHYDAPGSDGSNPNGEWVTLVNNGPSTVDLSLSALVSAPHHYRFGPNTILGQGDFVRVFIGSGTDTATKRYWGKSGGILSNGGDQVTLTTPGGQPAITNAWPCAPCGPVDPLEITSVNYNAAGPDNQNPNGEWIIIENTGSYDIDLRDWTVKNGKNQLNSKKSRIIQPGGKVTVYIGEGTWTDNKLYWGRTSALLANTGDKVKLLTPFGDIASCFAWGEKSC